MLGLFPESHGQRWMDQPWSGPWREDRFYHGRESAAGKDHPWEPRRDGANEIWIDAVAGGNFARAEGASNYSAGN